MPILLIAKGFVNIGFLKRISSGIALFKQNSNKICNTVGIKACGFPNEAQVNRFYASGSWMKFHVL